MVGLADNGSLADWIIEAAGIPANRYYRLTRREGTSGRPVMAPDMTWAQVRATAERVLPGVRYRRHLLWRYSLRWAKLRPSSGLGCLAHLGGCAGGDPDQFLERRGEHRVRVPGRGP